jgi:uncharacterized protein (TIGR00290 family)
LKKEKAIFCWSGGKDSAYCLHIARQYYDIVSLVTTVNKEFKRISMHGVREELLVAQAKSIGVKLKIVYVESPYSNRQYEKAMADCLLPHKEDGIENVIFGDIFLEDLRVWREKQLVKLGMKAVFPLWKCDTKLLINQFLGDGFKTISCCISTKFLAKEMVGREIDNKFIAELPDSVDPCGENGEFHSFVFDGPIFNKPLDITIGEKIFKPLEYKTVDSSHPCSDNESNATSDGFWYVDLML